MRSPEDSVQKTHPERARGWFNAFKESLLSKAENIGINTDLKTTSLPSRLNIEIPRFTWFESVYHRATGGQISDTDRRNSTESDYSIYFNDVNTGSETENDIEAQNSRQIEQRNRDEKVFVNRSTVSKEVSGKNGKVVSKKSLIPTDTIIQGRRNDSRTMSDPQQYLTSANDNIMRTINRLKSSFGNQLKIRKERNESTSCQKLRTSKVSEDVKQGELTLSMQYFANTSQLRLILLKADGIRYNSGKIIVKISLLGPGETQTHVSRKTYLFARKAQFNDNFYFETENDELYEYSIKLQMMKKRRFYRRSKIVGEVEINLGDLPLTLDTKIVAPLYKPQYSERMEAIDLHINSQTRSIQEDVMASLDITETMQLRSSLKRVNSMPISVLRKVPYKPLQYDARSNIM